MYFWLHCLSCKNKRAILFHAETATQFVTDENVLSHKYIVETVYIVLLWRSKNEKKPEQITFINIIIKIPITLISKLNI